MLVHTRSVFCYVCNVCVAVYKCNGLQRSLLLSKSSFAYSPQDSELLAPVLFIRFLTGLWAVWTKQRAIRSNKLQYNTLAWWLDETNDSTNKRLMFQALIHFSLISCKILCKNSFNLFSHFFYNFLNLKIKSFECHKSISNYIYKRIMLGTSNTWLISSSPQQATEPPNYIVDCRICTLDSQISQKKIEST